MSKQLPATIGCPSCGNKFEVSLYRTIWIEDPENRKLIFEDKINVATCPACKATTKLEFPFLCTNIKEHIAVWYEPYHDPDIDKDVAQYAKHFGPQSFYATAQRVRNWNVFKEKILELEQRTETKPPVQMSTEMQTQMRGFVDYLRRNDKQASPAGIMGLWGLLKDKLFGSSRGSFKDTDPLSLGEVLKSLAAEDAEIIARGEIPEARLIPHHAIKRDVILTAYHKDFQVAIDQIKSMNWVDAEKERRISEIRLDFDQKIYGLKRLGWTDLDKIIALMKKTRADLEELERAVRFKNSIYKIVDPL